MVIMNANPFGSLKNTARYAGVFYLLYIVTSIIANLFGKFVFVEAPVTVNHIMTHALQFRIGFVINLFSEVLFLLAAWALYVLLKPVNRDLALLFLILNLAGLAVWFFSSLCLFASLLVLNGRELTEVFQPEQLQALALFFVTVYKHGVFIAQVPYGVWLFPLGYLALRSNLLPKIFGMLLLADGVCQFIYVCQRLILLNLIKEYLDASVSKPVIDGCYPLDKAHEAFWYFEKERPRGKVGAGMPQPPP